MSITYEVPQGETLKDFVKVFYTAFEPVEADMIMPMIFPNGLTDDVAHWLENLIERRIEKDPGLFFVLARNSETRELVGVSLWTIVKSPPSTLQEIDTAYKMIMESENDAPVVKGMNEALEKAQSQASFYAEKTVMMDNGGRPYGVLSILAVHPEHHRRGIASILLKEGLQRMDSLGLPVYLDCGIQGKPLYEKFGFQFVKDYPLDAREYGGRSQGKHWCMLRPIQAT